MSDRIRSRGTFPAAIALLSLATSAALAQSSPRKLPPIPPGSPAPIGRYQGPAIDPSVRRTQTQPGDIAPPPPMILAPGDYSPGVPVPPDPATPYQPGLSNAADLALPADERDFGGGGGTETAEAFEAEEEPVDDRGLLMKALGAEPDSPVKIYGWIQNSYTGNTNGNGITRTNAGVTPNFMANKWMGNQYYLVIENPLEQDDTVNFGFRADNLFGNDWQFNYMQGLFNGAFRPGQFAGYDLAQIYGEVHLPIITEGGLDIKGGRFYTLAGYEVVPAISRPLLSVPYMFTFGQPFTHVGFMTTLHLTDRINLYNGAINGWDRWINQRYQWGYMGGFSWTSVDERTSLAFTAVWGPNQFPSFLPADQQLYPTGYINIPSVAGTDNPGYHKNDRFLFTTVLSHKWSDRLTQVVETDQGGELRVPGLAAQTVNGVAQSAAAKSAQWQSFGNWFLYEFDEKLTGVWRSEIFWDQQGVRTGNPDRFYEMTLGMIYKPQPWLWIRPEARYDWTQFHQFYTDGTRKEQLTLAFDIILLF